MCPAVEESSSAEPCACRDRFSGTSNPSPVRVIRTDVESPGLLSPEEARVPERPVQITVPDPFLVPPVCLFRTREGLGQFVRRSVCHGHRFLSRQLPAGGRHGGVTGLEAAR
jgi:hypothetical protein